jgi:hypothetical protein
MRTTYTYSILEIPKETFESIQNAITEAGPEYVSRYIKDDDDFSSLLIHFTGSEVALKPKNS